MLSMYEFDLLFEEYKDYILCVVYGHRVDFRSQVVFTFYISISIYTPPPPKYIQLCECNNIAFYQFRDSGK